MVQVLLSILIKYTPKTSILNFVTIQKGCENKKFNLKISIKAINC